MGVHITLRMRLECTILRANARDEGEPVEVLNEIVVDRGSGPYLTKIECWERDHLITKVGIAVSGHAAVLQNALVFLRDGPQVIATASANQHSNSSSTRSRKDCPRIIISHPSTVLIPLKCNRLHVHGASCILCVDHALLCRPPGIATCDQCVTDPSGL